MVVAGQSLALAVEQMLEVAAVLVKQEVLLLDLAILLKVLLVVMAQQIIYQVHQ